MTTTALGFSPTERKSLLFDQNNIWIYDLNRHTEHAITHDGSEVVLNGRLSFEYGEDIFSGDGFGIWWSPDSSAVAFLRTDVSGVGVIQYSTIFPYHPEVQSQYYPVAGELIEVVRVGLGRKLRAAQRDGPSGLGLSTNTSCMSNWVARQSPCFDTNAQSQAGYARYVFSSSARAVALCHVLTEHDSAWVNVSDDLYFLKNSKALHMGLGARRP